MPLEGRANSPFCHQETLSRERQGLLLQCKLALFLIGTKGSAPTRSKPFCILPHLQWLTVDPQTSCPLLHSDVSANCPIFRTGSESAWENDKQFRYLCSQYSHKIKDCTQVVITYPWCTLFSSPPSSFQLQTVDNLQTEKARQNVFVSASLCHGTDSLPDSVSPKVPIKSTINWSEEFVFSIQTRNLSKVRSFKMMF